MGKNRMKVSILLPAFKRPALLNLGLSSYVNNIPTYDYEILVLNDGIPDETESVCEKYKNLGLNVRYIFTGQRNLDGVIKSRVPGFALNIGFKQATGELITLSCPEVFHLNNAIDLNVKRYLESPRSTMVIPSMVYFDQTNVTTSKLLQSSNLNNEEININQLMGGNFGFCHSEMPYLFTTAKQNFIDIGGYDEDFIGYAGEDSDIIARLKLTGLGYRRSGAEVIHLFHEGTNDGGYHWDNPRWVHNWNLLNERKDIIIRNAGREWGVLEYENKEK